MDDKDTRYFVDLDLETLMVLDWGSDNRHRMDQVLPHATHHRIFVSEGQYNKLEAKNEEVKGW